MPILTDDNSILKHVDFWGAPFSFTYDLGEVCNVEKICISGYSGGDNYALNDFELYAANSEEELFNPENLVVKYYRSPDEDYKAGNPMSVPCDVLYDAEGSARFFGIKFLSACPADEIARIARIALFNDYTTTKSNLRKMLKVNDAFDGIVPQVTGDYSGCACYLGKNEAFNDEKAVKADSDIALEYASDKKLFASKIIAVAQGLTVEAIYADGNKADFSVEETETYDGRKIYTISLDETAANSFKLDIKKGAVIDSIFTDTSVRSAIIDELDVIDRDYIGSGCNVFPTALSTYGKSEGYNEVYWELEKHHIQKAKPHCVRMWFQIDWVVDTLEQYKNGDWQFDNPEMQSAVEYCKAFREQGIEIEFNFGWKIGRKVQSWFPVTGLDENMLRNAAPQDLYNYAKAAVGTLEYLILTHGCDNIKYLTFYNEATDVDSQRHDFAVHGDAVAYWTSMARYTKYFLDRSVLAGMVEIWGIEETMHFGAIMEKANILAPDVISRHTVHRYCLDYDTICQWCDEELIPNSDGKPVLLTEYGNSCRHSISWYVSHASNVLGGANHGLSGAFIWVMAGAPLVDPLNWMHAGLDSEYSYQHWNFLPNCPSLDDAGESFYELCLLNQYIPMHAHSIRSNPAMKYNDTRFNAFCKNGEYTVFVESRGDKATEVNISFGKELNRTFYRHTYQHHEKAEGNLIVPAVDKVMTATDSLHDTLDEGYRLVVYTTVKPMRQVIMDNVDIRVKAGTAVKVGASVLDDDAAQTPVFSISKSLIDGAELKDGVVYIPENARVGDMLSVKAELTTGEFGISIIRVI